MDSGLTVARDGAIIGIEPHNVWYGVAATWYFKLGRLVAVLERFTDQTVLVRKADGVHAPCRRRRRL